MVEPSSAPPLRKHQELALQALDRAWAKGRRRAWVVLPPGAGKTRVGIETILSSFADGRAARAVVFAPNTAIQAQWVATVRAHGLEAGTTRDLAAPVTCLTYQSLAVFDPDDEVDDDPELTPAHQRPVTGGLIDRLHPNGRALVEAMHAEPGLLLVLDECHHLLEVWGRLLGELLHTLEEARVLGLTATPPDALTADQSALVRELFADIVFRAGVPAVVKEGHLAPFAELAWLTTPTVHENEWLATEAVRWRELTTQLMDPRFGSLPFLEWLTARFVTPVPQVQTWSRLSLREPQLADAALRLCHAGLLTLPTGARLAERHRRAPDADDWVALIDDWVKSQVLPSDDERDAEVRAAVKRALPSVGYHLTRRGVRRGRTPVDRVLARSHAKTTAAVDIVSHELGLLGSRTRVLVLCDHERASATLPTGLRGVIDQQSGSAYAALEALVGDPTTATLSPMLVTASTVAGAPETLQRLAAFAIEGDPMLDGRLSVVPGDGEVAELTGPWGSREWVPPVTAFFEAGHCQVLVGTRGLLGEGWDARRISGLVDLTTATTLTAVVQTRGRALRTDPLWPDKVAVNWSVVCVSEEHPKGAADWARLVRKHEGFHGVDDDGDVVDGVGHIDAAFSPYAPPPAELFDAVNGRMRDRAADREGIRERWRVGEPYSDRVVSTVRVRSARARPIEVEATGLPAAPVPPPLVLAGDGIQVRDAALRPPDPPALPGVLGVSGFWGGLGVSVMGSSSSLWLVPAGVVLAGSGLAAVAAAWRRRNDHYRSWVLEQARQAVAAPSVLQVAAAVAQGLADNGTTLTGVDRLVVEVHPGGEYRCRLASSERDASRFALALDEVLGPITSPRYVVSRSVRLADPIVPQEHRLTRGSHALAALTGIEADGVVWHPVPTALGQDVSSARFFHRAWERWVGPGRILYTGSPEGAGVLAAQQGADPFDATTVLRRQWV
ncbi:DEAD/DEAH box helicase family protein [Nocardioides ferulae]|uniref:DEAD/DEAH box helicase family protein n=1 Tax=Nocardioides ferulae TaxID=2340821 RepID=UPI000EAD3405|nr:DEAD/DEAH box helicase family protein [Nocardioides ferulae]